MPKGRENCVLVPLTLVRHEVEPPSFRQEEASPEFTATQKRVGSHRQSGDSTRPVETALARLKDHRKAHMTRREGGRAEDYLPSGIPMPQIPEGIPEEESTGLGVLAAMLVAYHRTLPESMQDEYVRQVMRFAGEKAGQLIRATWE